MNGLVVIVLVVGGWFLVVVDLFVDLVGVVVFGLVLEIVDVEVDCCLQLMLSINVISFNFINRCCLFMVFFIFFMLKFLMLVMLCYFDFGVFVELIVFELVDYYSVYYVIQYVC